MINDEESWANAREMIFVDRQLAQDVIALGAGMRLEEIINKYALPLWIEMQKYRTSNPLEVIEQVRKHTHLLD